MIGDGPERPFLEDLARESDFSADIKFLGKQEQMESLLPIADLFILPSEYESFGLAALEAMAAEVPVISTNAGGLPEINIDGYCGFMSKVGDVEDMAKNAMKILEDDVTYAIFKKNALAQALKFDIINIVPIYETLYTSLLATHKSVI